jgi:hypothetical protein
LPNTLVSDGVKSKAWDGISRRETQDTTVPVARFTYM